MDYERMKEKQHKAGRPIEGVLPGGKEEKPLSRSIFRLSVLLCGGLLIAGQLPLAQAELLARQAPLRGSASINIQPLSTMDLEDIPPIPGKAWHPIDRQTRRADWLTETYALNAAEVKLKDILTRDPKNAGAHNALGKVAYYRTTSSNQDMRDRTDFLYQEAIQHFLTALRYRPNYVEARLNLGTMYLQQGRMNDAHEEFRRALKVSPNNADALSHMAGLLIENQRYDEALPYLQKSLKLHSHSATTHYLLGVVHTERGEYTRAHEMLQAALHMAPASAPIHYRLGVLYEEQGNGAAAVAEFKKALELKPEYAQASLRLADHYERRGDLDFTLEQLKNTQEAYPEDRALAVRIAELAMENRQPEVAIQYYQGLLLKNPEDGHAKEGVSRAYAQMARNEAAYGDIQGNAQALRNAEQSLVYQPNNYQARLVQVKLDGEANGIFEKSPDSATMDATLRQVAYGPHGYFQQAEVLYRRYQFDLAEPVFRGAIRASESEAQNIALGELFLELGAPNLAEESFHHLLSNSPGNVAADLGLKRAAQARKGSTVLVDEADFYKRKGYYDKSSRLLKQALDLNVRNADAHYKLAVLYEKQKNYPKAADHYYAWLKLEPVSSPERTRVERHVGELTSRVRSSQG